MPRAAVPGSGWARRFDSWAGSYDASQLQRVLFEPAHEAVLSYLRLHVAQPGMILDAGCGTGRLAARLGDVYRGARIAGLDLSAGMIGQAAARAGPALAFVAGCAEELPFGSGVFDLVVVTLSMAHWWDAAAGLDEIRRVMAPGAVLVAAETVPVPAAPPGLAVAWRRKPRTRGGLPSLISAGGLRVRHVEPIHPFALTVDAALVAAGHPRAGSRRQPPGAGHRAGDH